MTNPDKVNKILECYRTLKEEGAAMGASAAGLGPNQKLPTNNASDGAIAGFPPEDPPVDLRKRKHRKLNMFYRQAVKQSRKGASNGRKRS